MAWSFLVEGIEEHFDIVNGDYPLYENKWYLYGKGCVQYKGEVKDGSGIINLVGGPFNESQCKDPYELIYHFVNGDCNSQQQFDYYYRRVLLNGEYITPEQNRYYEYENPKDGDRTCYLYLGTVKDSGQSVGNVRVLTGGPYNLCNCDNECHEFEECNNAMHKLIYAQTINFVNVERELIQGKKYLIDDEQIKCYTYNGIVQNLSTSTVDIIDGPFDNCDCEDKPEPPTTENSECVVSTCKGKEQHINVSNDILNLLEQRDYHTFKWNNKCYYILEVVGEENPELPIMDIEHLNDIYPGCTECNNDGVTHKDNTEYYEKVNCEFASAVYNKAMSDRYGVEFCCDKDLQLLTIKKKLLDAGQLQDDIDLCEL